MAKVARFDRHHRMADRAEIIDKGHPIDSEPVTDESRPDDPRIVGELQHLACDGAGYRDCRGARQRVSRPVAESLPRSLQAGISCGAEGDGLSELRDMTVGHLSDGKSRMCATDVDRNEFH